MRNTTIVLALMILLLSACASQQKPTKAAEKNKAQQIAQKYILVDGHIDVPYRLEYKWEDVTKATDGGDFDYPRAVAGGLNAPFMSIYVPASLDNSDESTKLANKLIDYVEAIVGRAPDKFAVATNPTEVREQFSKGLISLPMGMENGSPVQGSLETLKHFYDRGVRYITLAHSQSNHISDSSYDIRRKWKGLSPFGKEMVEEMNKLGIMVDISHVSDNAFYQAIEISKVPVIASHSSLRTYTPGFERNMDDDMIKALGKNGGVIMINFGSSFVSQMSRSWYDNFNKEREAIAQQYGRNSSEYATFTKQYRENSPFPFASTKMVLDHIDHVVALVGIDHVGIGSDYDGVGDSLPEGLKDVSTYPNLVQGLMDRGYSEAEIAKILGGNLLRVWQQVEDYATEY